MVLPKADAEANTIAAEHFTKAAAEFPENAEAYRGLANCENSKWLFDFDRNGLTNGLKLAERSVELDATNALCHCVRGFCQLFLGDIAAATESYDKALSLNPGDPYIRAELGLLHVWGNCRSAANTSPKPSS